MSTWSYEKLDEEGKIKTIAGDYTNDADGKITGRIVMNVKAWFDENPEERIRQGWTKHIHWTKEEMEEKYPYNKQSQYQTSSQRQIDDYTVEDVYYVVDKSEAQMALEEMLRYSNYDTNGIIFFDE